MIFEATEQKFFEKGFENSKTTKKTSLADIIHAMLHYYYRTKENLFIVECIIFAFKLKQKVCLLKSEKYKENYDDTKEFYFVILSLHNFKKKCSMYV